MARTRNKRKKTAGVRLSLTDVLREFSAFATHTTVRSAETDNLGDWMVDTASDTDDMPGMTTVLGGGTDVLSRGTPVRPIGTSSLRSRTIDLAAKTIDVAAMTDDMSAWTMDRAAGTTDRTDPTGDFWDIADHRIGSPGRTPFPAIGDHADRRRCLRRRRFRQTIARLCGTLGVVGSLLQPVTRWCAAFMCGLNATRAHVAALRRLWAANRERRRREFDALFVTIHTQCMVAAGSPIGPTVPAARWPFLHRCIYAEEMHAPWHAHWFVAFVLAWARVHGGLRRGLVHAPGPRCMGRARKQVRAALFARPPPLMRPC